VSSRTRNGVVESIPMSTVATWAPGWPALRHYRGEWLRGDLLAGVTVAAYLIPQVMAYATVAGLPPVAGLWAALAPMLVYALLGSSRQLSVGPESTTAIMTATALAPLALADPARYAALAAALAVLVGVICLVAGLCRLGFLADLLSRPVLAGYMAGVAVIMIAGQLGKVTGVEVEGEEFVDQIRSFLAGVGGFHLSTSLLALGVLVLLFALKHYLPRVPAALTAVLLATALVMVFGLDRTGIDVVGAIPAGLPAFGLPQVALADLRELLIPALGIAVVGFSDNTLTARIFAARKDEDINANAELRALGVCNLAAGLSHGFPVSSSGSRTALGDAVGSRSQLYSLTALATVLVVMVVGRGLLEHFPMAALGALVIYAAVGLVDIAEFRRLARFRRSEFMLAIATTVAVLLLGVLYGVLFAIALSIVDLLRRVARPHDAVLGYVQGMAGMHDVDDYPEATPVPGLVVYRYDAPLFFANAQDFRERAMRAVDDATGPVEWFVLNCETNIDPDITAVDAMEQLRGQLAERGITFAMARVKQDLWDDLLAAGLIDRVGEDRIFPTLPTAVEAFRNRPDR